MGQVEVTGKVGHVIDGSAAPDPDTRHVTLVGGSGHGKIIGVGGNVKWINHYGDWYRITNDTIAKAGDRNAD